MDRNTTQKRELVTTLGSSEAFPMQWGISVPAQSTHSPSGWVLDAVAWIGGSLIAPHSGDTVSEHEGIG